MAKTKAVDTYELQPVLDLVNKYRAVLELKPLKDLPQGEPMEAKSCPIAKAMKLEEASRAWLIPKNSQLEKFGRLLEALDAQITGSTSVIRTPATLAKFIRDFDSGNYPDLESK